MKYRKAFIFKMALIILFIVSGNGYADGGAGEGESIDGLSPCEVNLSNTTTNYDGPLIEGTFTSHQYPGQDLYFTHIVLEGMKIENEGAIPWTELYILSKGTDKDLCEYTDAYLMHKYKLAPCFYNVHKDFGYDIDDTPDITTDNKADEYYPVLTDLRITKRDNCDSNNNKMIFGTIKIRISPITPPDSEQNTNGGGG